MTTVSMAEFRRDAEGVIRQVENGKRMVLTYRGKPVMTLGPIDKRAADDDPFFAIGELADAEADSLTNDEIDCEIYGG